MAAPVAASSASEAWSLATATTCAPALPSPSVIPRPSPLLAPTTSAVLPVSVVMNVLPFSFRRDGSGRRYRRRERRELSLERFHRPAPPRVSQRRRQRVW